MQDKKRELEKLIERYSTAKLTDAERAHLTRWLRELDVNESYRFDNEGDRFDMEGVQTRMKEKIDLRLLATETPTKIAYPSWLLWGKVAAVVLFCFSFGWYLLDRNSSGDAQNRQFVKVEKMVDKSKVITYAAVQDSTIVLEDGSKVRLLANSSISLMQPFPAKQRAIQLQGKAFFEVSHDKSRPFTVLSGNILTTALGTSFWVVQEAKNRKPSVRLITGRVSIKEHGENGEEKLLAYLNPGQIWAEKVVQPKKEPVLKPEKPVEEIVPTILEFHHKPLAEVLPALASFYRTTILFSPDDVSGLSFYGTYTTENEVAQILQTICIANELELKFNTETNTYTILKNSQ